MKTITLVITQGCNLSCEYCYIKNEDIKMTREAFLKYHESFPLFLSYRIAFFGGEPLLNWELIVYITEYLSQDKRCKGLDIYSNGLLLTQEMCDFIKTNNINFIWSCDGEYTGNTRQGANIQDYYDKMNLLEQVVTETNVMITPDNMNMVDIHTFFKEQFDILPSMRIIRDDIWSNESVVEFMKNFKDYLNYLTIHPDEIPKWIYREIEYIYKGVIKNEYRPDCKTQLHSECLMPDGSIHLCPKMAVSGVKDEYDDILYKKCKDCDVNIFCEKQCYEQVLKNGEPIDTICDIYKILYHGIIEFDENVRGNQYTPWINYVRTLI